MSWSDHPNAILLLLLGVFYAAVGVGGLSAPGHWRALVLEMSHSPLEQMLGGMAAFLIGAALLLASPADGDWRHGILLAFGWLALVKGVVMTALPGRFLHLTDGLLAHRERAYAVTITLAGIALVVIALLPLRIA